MIGAYYAGWPGFVIGGAFFGGLTYCQESIEQKKIDAIRNKRIKIGEQNSLKPPRTPPGNRKQMPGTGGPKGGKLGGF